MRRITKKKSCGVGGMQARSSQPSTQRRDSAVAEKKITEGDCGGGREEAEQGRPDRSVAVFDGEGCGGRDCSTVSSTEERGTHAAPAAGQPTGRPAIPVTPPANNSGQLPPYFQPSLVPLQHRHRLCPSVFTTCQHPFILSPSPYHTILTAPSHPTHNLPIHPPIYPIHSSKSH